MNAMTALKIATQSHHHMLEANRHMHRLMSDTITNAEYTRIITQMYGFYVPLEARLAAFDAQFAVCGIDFERRRKVPLLERDLIALGVPASEIAELSLCTCLPSIQSFPQAVGVIYVLEGSTLGGRVISRHLMYRLGLKSERGVAFFSSYTTEIGVMWKELSTQINSYAEQHFKPEDTAAMILSAQATFQTLDDWLSHTAMLPVSQAVSTP